MKLAEIASCLGVPCVEDAAVLSICINSRDVKPGCVFVAIQGERFDGHDFVHEAVVNGAVAIVCQKRTDDVACLQFVVSDTVQALASIATYHRSRLNCNVIALTGSNGKTTVKEMIACILPQSAFATPGNFNNHIGAPLSVLQLNSSNDYAVFELGANHRYEIAHTVGIVSPCVTLINNIAPAHIEGFGSIDGVAQAKGELHQGLTAGGVAVINADDNYAHFWDEILVGKKILRFSAKHSADVYARDMRMNENGCAVFTLVTPKAHGIISLKVPGMHQVSNALAAAACTYALGINFDDIMQGLSNFSGVLGRMSFLDGKQNAVIIDDTYNANLRSVLTALEVLAARSGRRVFVFGDMGELGSSREQHHQDVGLAARSFGIDIMMTCGVASEGASRAFGDNARHYLNQKTLVADLLNQLDADTTVLVKGSRSSAMDNIVRELI